MSSTATPELPETTLIIRTTLYPSGGGAMAREGQESTAAALGARLAQLRKNKGITQTELAEMLGISQPMVSDYERGELRLHGELILRLMEILEVSADEMLGVKTDEKRNGKVSNRRLYRRLTAIDRLPKRDQEALLRTIDAFLSKAQPTAKHGGRHPE